MAITSTSGTTDGSGSGKLTLRVSADLWQGDPQFIVKVGGVQVGGVQTTHAQHSLGEWQDITLQGDFQSTGQVQIQFLNDAYGGTSTTDRNLFVDKITLNGQ